ncbi:MAG TPA: NADAR family protein [Pyrinomonadaceae bacterium]|nr:NADAR family protein [Pyrinomonadaceae bacterium]
MSEKKVINFYLPSGEYGCFSNFSRHRLFLKDKVWKTSEHYFQAQKFEGTKFEEQVRLAPTPKEAANLGRNRKFPFRKDWKEVKDDIMREALQAKFTQNKDLKRILLETGNAELVEHTANDNYWGDGGDGSGRNILGKLLMEVREELKKVD